MEPDDSQHEYRHDGLHDEDTVHTGGCQCGAIRFKMKGTPLDRSICHCRMCQKAFGNFYAPLVNTRDTEFEWTRGEVKRWQSSNYVMRGFCGDCGTPLSYEAEDGLAVSIGAFDDPTPLMPLIQFGMEGKIEWVDDLSSLPGRITEEDVEFAPFLADIKSNQHPDHNTDAWPETEKDE